ANDVRDKQASNKHHHAREDAIF
ncbi:hypothetical protein D027_0770B, partial [Vibrio parahaemolyticus 861]